MGQPPAPIVAADATATANGQARDVTLLGAVAIGIGGMVGGGIFAVLGVAATEARGATPIAFAVAGIVAGLTAYSYARLSTYHQNAGGTITFVNRAFGVDALTGGLNVVLWVGYIATTALYVSAFANYAATFLPGGPDPGPVVLRLLIGVGVLIPWFVNLANAGLVARSETFIVGAKLALLAVVVAAGVPHVSVEQLSPAKTWPSLPVVVAAGMLIFVAYEGFELIANASADIRQPRRNLPLAFGISVGLVIVLYIAIAAVVVGSLTPAEIAKSADIALARAADASLGGVGFTLVAVSALLATLSATNATLYGAARLSFALAVDGELAAGFTRRKWNQPIGLHVTAIGGLALAAGLPLASISTVCSAIFLIVFCAVNAAAFRSAGEIGAMRWVAGLGAAACAVSLVALLARAWGEDPAGLVVLVVLLAVSIGAERFMLRRGRPVECAWCDPSEAQPAGATPG
jgi:amino acid transporter